MFSATHFKEKLVKKILNKEMVEANINKKKIKYQMNFILMCNLYSHVQLRLHLLSGFCPHMD